MLVKYLPKFMQEVEEFKILNNSCEANVLEIYKASESILKNMFINDAAEDGLAMYEELLNIFPKDTDTLETRRENILSIFNQVLPFTYNSLKLMISSISKGKWTYIKVDNINFILYFKVKLKDYELRECIEDLLERVVPVNISLEVGFEPISWKELSSFRWSQLQTYKWKEFEEV